METFIKLDQLNMVVFKLLYIQSKKVQVNKT